MVPVDQIQEPLEQLGALVLGHVVDLLDVDANGEDALPAGDGVGAHDRVDCLELGSDVLGRAPRLVVDFEPGDLGDLVEAWLFEGGGEALEESLIRLADAVVDFVARRPESVCGGEDEGCVSKGLVSGGAVLEVNSPPPVVGSCVRRSDV